MRMVVNLTDVERQVLSAMSEHDMRFPREQIRFLLLQEAERRGLLPVDAAADDRPAELQHAHVG